MIRVSGCLRVQLAASHRHRRAPSPSGSARCKKQPQPSSPGGLASLRLRLYRGDSGTDSDICLQSCSVISGRNHDSTTIKTTKTIHPLFHIAVWVLVLQNWQLSSALYIRFCDVGSSFLRRLEIWAAGFDLVVVQSRCQAREQLDRNFDAFGRLNALGHVGCRDFRLS